MTQQRYHSAAILLHWLMAVAILLMLASGLAISNLSLSPSFQFQLIQWHKSLGVLVLLAAVLRVLVRLTFTPPPLPASIPARDKTLAHLGHVALYALMLLIPLSGWLMVSASPYGLPTIVFGWFTWPHIPGTAMNTTLYTLSNLAHEYLAYALILLLIGHLAAVYHHTRHHAAPLLPRLWW